MRNLILTLLAACFLWSCSSKGYNDGNIQYGQENLTIDEKRILENSLEELHKRYDPEEKMISQRLRGWNYHTDAESGTFHDVRSSFRYAVMLLDLGDEQYEQRAFDIIDKTITLQDQDTTSRSCGVWPYFLEEPLATKKSPIDFNWADFNAVRLLEVWMGHHEKIPENLKPAIKKSLILAANSIQKRNVGPGYTNIAIMGTYVTYVVSHLFAIPDMNAYAQNRLNNFYNYTLDKGGFSEYNSPTYTIVALDELYRMKKHIIEPSAKQMIDSLYSIGWETIARHYHLPTGQWAGPHSRSYSTIVNSSFYAMLNEASNGKIDTIINVRRGDVKVKHQIPEYLLHYFTTPEFPRTEKDIFEKTEPQTTGTSYLAENFAVSTANRSSLWNQRRPFLVYWGTIQDPKYLQLRFLLNNYDFSSATFYSQQNENKVLAGINFIKNGGNKHISIDKLKDGKFRAKDLRLRFEFGNINTPGELTIPISDRESFSMTIDGLNFNFQLYQAEFDGLKGHWERGGDEKKSWIDYVFYSGTESEFDLRKINRAVIGFVFSLEPSGNSVQFGKPDLSEENGILNVRWNGLQLAIPVKPQTPEKSFI